MESPVEALTVAVPSSTLQPGDWLVKQLLHDSPGQRVQGLSLFVRYAVVKQAGPGEFVFSDRFGMGVKGHHSGDDLPLPEPRPNLAILDRAFRLENFQGDGG